MSEFFLTVATEATSDLRIMLEIVGAVVAAILGVLGGRRSMKGKSR